MHIHKGNIILQLTIGQKAAKAHANGHERVTLMWMCFNTLFTL